MLLPVHYSYYGRTVKQHEDNGFHLTKQCKLYKTTYKMVMGTKIREVTENYSYVVFNLVKKKWF